ncbi:YceI family protein [Shewanella maritima]|uniref:YceI family protein n=1 Tax=Shewanella maritima TaxID=2520507 RepID=UPI003736F01F
MKTWLPIVMLSLCSSSIYAADWQVSQAHSRVNFISIKKQDIAEVHTFDAIAGQYSDSGEFSLKIPLNSVNTGIEIRDERMQKILFEVAKFPKLQLTAKVDPKLVSGLNVGDTLVTQVTGEIDLHGMKVNKNFDVMVAKLAKDKMVVTSLQPVVVSAADFGLTEGVEKLREVAGLTSISLAVPVTFVLTLTQ